MLEVLQACGFYRIPQMVKTTIGIVFNLFQDETISTISIPITTDSPFGPLNLKINMIPRKHLIMI